MNLNLKQLHFSSNFTMKYNPMNKSQIVHVRVVCEPKMYTQAFIVNFAEKNEM